MKKYLVALTIISLIALWPFFKKGYFESDDGEWMVIRFSAFHQTLAAGQFPVRFVDRLNSNYGYPVLNFLYPLPFYLAEIPKVLGLGFVASIKVVFVTSTIASVLLMFWALCQKFSKEAAALGSVIYLFIPYRFADLYLRGSLGECLAFVFLGAIYGSIQKLKKGDTRYFPVLSLSFGLLILSHNVIAALFIPVFLLLAFFESKKTFLKTTLAALWGFAISAFFAVPAIFDLKYVKYSTVQISQIGDYLSTFTDLVIPTFSIPISPVQFGTVSLFVFITASYLYFSKKAKDTTIIILLALYALTFLLMLNIALPFWQNVPFADTIQFPWRMLSIVVFASAVAAAFIQDSLKIKNLNIILAAAAIITTVFYAKPAVFTDKGEGFYSTNEGTTTVKDEYLPKWAVEKPQMRASQKIITQANAQTISQTIRPSNYTAEISSVGQSEVVVNTVFFPGWKAYLDGIQIPISYDNQFGLINFALPEGKHTVIIKYTGTNLHTASNLVSLFSLLAVGAYFILSWRKQNS